MPISLPYLRRALGAPLLSIALLGAALTCRAEPPSAESIDALLVAMKSESLVESLNANMESTLRQSIALALNGKAPPPRLQRFMDDAPHQFAEAMKEELSWTTLKPLYVQLYQETFTQEEVDGLVAFYRSPAGEALTKKMPIAMQKTMQLVQARMAPVMERFRIITAKAMAEAQSKK